jgi:hypothetical protein
MKQIIFGIGTVALLSAACVSIQVAPERWGRLDQTIQQAEQLGASQVPMAALHLKLAREQDLTARQLAATGDYRADLVLARAQADAALAVALSHEAAIKRSMDQTDARLKAAQEGQPGGSR